MNFRVNDKEKDDFYETELCRSPKTWFQYNCYRWNGCECGPCPFWLKNVMGKPAWKKKNDNAENLVDSLLDYSLTEGGPRFQYGDIHTHIDTERQRLVLTTTDVYQRCIVSSFMFLLGIDWLVKQVTEEKRKTFTNAPEEIYFPYDISLSSHTQKNICRKRQTRFRRKATNLSLRSIKVNND